MAKIPCEHRGLKERGWRCRKKKRGGRWVWQDPAKVREQERKRQAGLAAPAQPLVNVSRDVSIPKNREALQATLKKMGEGNLASLVERCDAQSFRLWMTVAYARLCGMSDDQIALLTGSDADLVGNLINSPPFILFESELRRVFMSEDTRLAIQVEIAQGAMEGVKSLKFWAGSRDAETAGASVTAAKALIAAAGVVTDRSERTIRKFTISKRKQGRLQEALVRKS